MSLQSMNTLIWLLLYVNSATPFQEKKETPKCNYNNTTVDDTCCPYCMNSLNDSCKTLECPKDYYHFNDKCNGKHDKLDSNMFVCKTKCPASHYGITVKDRKVCLACMILCHDRSLNTTCSCEDIYKETQLKEILLYILIGISVLLVIALVLMVVYVCCKNRSGDIIHSSEKCIQVDIREINISSNVDKAEEGLLIGQPKASLVAKEAQIQHDKKTRYIKDPTTTVGQGQNFQKVEPDRPSSLYENQNAIRGNENFTVNNEILVSKPKQKEERNKTKFQDTTNNLPIINDDERNIKIFKDGISPSKSKILNKFVTAPFYTNLGVGNGNTPKEDSKEGDYDTVEEDPDEKGYATLHFKDGTNEITDIENITQSKDIGLVKGHIAACSFKKCKIPDNNKKNNFESSDNSVITDIDHRASDISSSSFETARTGSPRSDLMSESSQTVIPVQEHIVQTLSESDIHHYENYQGSTNDVDNIEPTEFTDSGNASVSDMRQSAANTNVNEKIASIGLNNIQSNRCSQDSSDSNRSEDSYKSARSHASLPENPMGQISSNKEQTIIEIDTTNNANINNDVKNVAVLKGSVEVTKIASQPNINVTGNNISLSFVYHEQT